MMGRQFYEEEGKTCVTVAGRPRNMTNCMQNENRSYNKTSLKTGLIIRPIRFSIRPILKICLIYKTYLENRSYKLAVP